MDAWQTPKRITHRNDYLKYSILKIFFFLLFIFPLSSFSQTDNNQTQNSNGRGCIFFVDESPVFSGGEEALIKYLSKIKCPSDTTINKPGRTYVGFIVTETGKIKDVRILKSAESGCDQEILRLISEMPDWKPGKFHGKIVPVEMHLPIKID